MAQVERRCWLVPLQQCPLFHCREREGGREGGCIWVCLPHPNICSWAFKQYVVQWAVVWYLFKNNILISARKSNAQMFVQWTDQPIWDGTNSNCSSTWFLVIFYVFVPCLPASTLVFWSFDPLLKLKLLLRIQNMQPMQNAPWGAWFVVVLFSFWFRQTRKPMIPFG
jgi:hypothetical protein